MAPDQTDRIGDRLDHPERVPPELRHLIADDQQRVARILSIPVAGRVLDVGCSDGAITRRIAERWSVVAIGADIREDDTSDDQMIYWDIRDPFPRRTPLFDTVYACEVFEHLTDADANRALANILDVLQDDGSLIVTVPNRHPHDLYEVGCRSRWAWPDHRASFTKPKLEAFLLAFFTDLEFLPLYDHETPEDSIWLICRAAAKR